MIQSVMSGGRDEDVRTRYEDVCAELSMDEPTAKRAWSSYEEVNNDYVLEGDHIEWLGCALYVAGQMATMETIEGAQATGNNISLTHILRSTKLSLIEFFKKIKKWQEMTKMVHDFQKKIDTLERKFEVASIIFNKYHRVFHDLFLPLEERPATASRRGGGGGRKKLANKPCSTAELFKFGWTLYIHIKGQYPQINDDLVNSHHLLLCAMDMLFCAAVIGRRRDLLNPDCPFLSDDPSSSTISSSSSSSSSDPAVVSGDEKMCILTELAEKYGAIEKECRVIRDFYWRDPVKKMFEKKELLGLQPGNPRHSVSIDAAFVHMLNHANFHGNQRALDREYEMSMLANGDFDERMFLHPNASQEIGTPSRLNATLSSRLMMTQTPPHHVQYTTPLLGREYLTTANSMTPVSDATHSVTQLHLLLESGTPSPADDLCRMCSSCTANPLPEIERRVASFGETFLNHSPQETEATAPLDSFTRLRLHLATSLYYKLLLGVVRDEVEVKKVSVTTLQIMLEHELFHKALFALSTEIVLFSYNSQSRVFPWVLGVFEVSAYHFYKLIEVAIKVEANFPRSIIKHLNRVEESVLDHFAWVSDSPLYDAIEAAGSVPCYEDVALPPVAAGGVVTPLIHHTHSRVASALGKLSEASPIASLLREHLASPSSARRQLFSPSSSSSSSTSKKTPGRHSGTPTRPIPIAPKPAAGSAPPPLSGSGVVGGGGGGGVTVTLLRDYLQQQHNNIAQQLQGAMSPPSGASAAAAGGRGGGGSALDPTSPLKLVAVSMASAGTQTSPCRPFSLASSGVSVAPALPVVSPGRNFSTALAQAVNLALPSGGGKPAPTGVTPASRTGLLSSSAAIPLSPPIPSVSITPSPSKTPRQHGSAISHTSTPSTLTKSSSSPPRPKKTGSLSLFYRKVYMTAHLRIKDLCERLDQSADFHQKVWTCFEYAMLQAPDLMRDRHLDQVVMCCIYVMAKVLRLDITFQEIMRQYRHQPQAKSHIYRNVLLNNGPRQRPQPDSSSSVTSTSSSSDEPMTRRGGGGGGGGEEVSRLLPSRTPGTPMDQLLYRSDIEVGARGDIIMFYNKVFISLIKNYALRFTPGDSNEAAPTLSPLPTIRKTSPSPRRLSQKHSIFVSPHTPSSLQLSPHAKKYVVQRSPAAHLHEINEAMRGPERTPGSKVKRKLSMLEASPYTSGPTKRVHTEAHGGRSTLMEQLKMVATDRAKAGSQLPPTTTPSNEE